MQQLCTGRNKQLNTNHFSFSVVIVMVRPNFHARHLPLISVSVFHAPSTAEIAWHFNFIHGIHT